MHCKEEGILLLDEPEPHFHPRWQWLLLDALLELIPQGQIVVATHSRDIVDGLDPNELIEFHEEEAGEDLIVVVTRCRRGFVGELLGVSTLKEQYR